MYPENTEEIRILEQAGLCAMRKVLAASGSSHSSTELQECAIRQWEERMTWVAAVASVAMASMALMVAWVASSGGVDGFDGVDGGGFDGVDGRRWRRMVASNGGNWGLRRRGH